MRWGMSDKIGNIDYANEQQSYLGHGGGSNHSARPRRS